MMKTFFKNKRSGDSAPATTKITLGDALEQLSQRAEVNFQRANLAVDPEERVLCMGEGSVLWNFVSRSQEEAALGLCDLGADLNQGWVLDSIASQNMLLRNGNDEDTPGAISARMAILGALSNK